MTSKCHSLKGVLLFGNLPKTWIHHAHGALLRRRQQECCFHAETARLSVQKFKSDHTVASKDAFRSDEQPKERRWTTENSPSLSASRSAYYKEVDIGNALRSTPDEHEKRQLKRELDFLTDRVKLTDAIRKHLFHGGFSKALHLVRVASASTKCTVSWNAIIEFLVEKREFDAAFRIYNEMKKRAQFPDAITITHLLKGLAQKPVKKQQVSMAMKVYDALDAQTSHVKRSIIHTNSMLKVCINSGDMDLMWKLISQMPERGDGAMDRITFSTIFQGLKEQMQSSSGKDAPLRGATKEGLSDGRRLWNIATEKWRSGGLQMDDVLLRSYLQLLLTDANEETALEVLGCIELTMGIPTREGTHLASSTNSEGETNLDRTQRRNFAGRRPRQAVKRELIRPHPATLSLIMDTYLALLPDPPTDIRSPESYWKIFTQDLEMNPDENNYKSYLRIAIQKRDSAAALWAVEENYDAWKKYRGRHASPSPTLYTMALTACATSAADQSPTDTSPTSSSAPSTALPLRHAYKILEIMGNRLAARNPQTVQKFLACAVNTHSPELILDTLQRLQPIVSSMQEDPNSKTPMSVPSHPQRRGMRKLYAKADLADQNRADFLRLYAATVAVLGSKESYRALDGSGRLEDLRTLSEFTSQMLDYMEEEGRDGLPALGKHSLKEATYRSLVKAVARNTGDEGRDFARMVTLWTWKGSLVTRRERTVEKREEVVQDGQKRLPSLDVAGQES
ncbi:Pentatricopeptide repeat-containing protein 2, mitochondrial [Elsinoe australis]|uniref:Pentatricopeptide repeat-containing protein 2, mitochondrial n=1 Tax=Elsinoe australis TaxID=40998 RepID=A0A2P8AE41_9PEZI|nr:Pentatricopeptide repeat-containing protein 2, mitochondrial [Elsinoe australis]